MFDAWKEKEDKKHKECEPHRWSYSEPKHCVKCGKRFEVDNNKIKKMTVKRLKELIANLPDEMEVILQKDSEGNGYSPMAGADPNAVYIPKTTWCGDVYSMDWSADDAGMTDEELAIIRAIPRALILYPVN